jgi:thymidylate kinase
MPFIAKQDRGMEQTPSSVHRGPVRHASGSDRTKHVSAMLRRGDAAVEVISASLSRLREPSRSRKHASAKIGIRSVTHECDDLVMIVIIEGADLVGKSTLAERVAKAHDWPIVKIRWALVGDAKAETFGMANATIELLAATTPDVILDRSYFSMWAYGEEVSYVPELIGRFDQVSRITPARLVLLTASEAALRQRFAREPDRYHTLEIIQRANHRFPSLLALVPKTLPALHIDTSQTAIEAAADQVEAFLRKPGDLTRDP